MSHLMSAGRGRPALLLFLFFQALYALTTSGNVFRVPDEFEVYFQVEHLVDAGDLSVPQALAITRPVVVEGRIVGREPVFFGKTGRDGKPYAPYGPLAAVLSLPHHLAARAVAALTGVPRPAQPSASAWMFLVAGLTSLASSTAAALAVAGFYRAALLIGGVAAPGSARRALVLSLLLGGATVFWPYATDFFSEAFLAAALVWAAALLLEARAHPSGARARVIAAACLLAVSGLTKATASIYAVAFVVGALAIPAPALSSSSSSSASSSSPSRTGAARSQPGVTWRARLRVAFALAAGAALGAGLQMAWSAWRFGDPFELGYDWSETIPTRPFRPFALEELPRGLFVLLLSPGKSLLLWAPPLVLGLMRARRLWTEDRGLAIGLGAGLAASLVFFGSYVFPEGGYAHGPRHLVPLVPLLLLAAVPSSSSSSSPWAAASPSPSASPSPWAVVGAASSPAASTRPLPRAAAVALGGVGLVMAMLAVSISYLDDQALGARLDDGARTGYYERIDPAPGRAWNRYAPGYVPFVRALTTPDWLAGTVVGKGPDFLPYHLARVRQLVPGGQAIPAWLPYLFPLPWLALLVWSGWRLARCDETSHSQFSSTPSSSP